jgi:hypothetical protein
MWIAGRGGKGAGDKKECPSRGGKLPRTDLMSTVSCSIGAASLPHAWATRAKGRAHHYGVACFQSRDLFREKPSVPLLGASFGRTRGESLSPDLGPGPLQREQGF